MDGTDHPAIEIDALRKVYAGGVEAVKGIDFEVAPGEVFSLLGPNGAGKSTTIGMLTATVAPRRGPRDWPDTTSGVSPSRRGGSAACCSRIPSSIARSAGRAT